MKLAATCLAAAIAVAAFTVSAVPSVELEPEAREALSVLGADVVGAPLPAPPIDDPSRLRHLAPETLKYRILAGANRGQIQRVSVERIEGGEPGMWQVATDGDEIQQLRVTAEHEIVKLSQTDRQSDRVVVYRPGLVLESGMEVGQSRTVKTKLATYRDDAQSKLEFEGELDYTTRYLGRFVVTTPAGEFDSWLLEHRYTMKIGPAKAHYHSYGFYADGFGNVAEVSEESISALFVYRRSSNSARVLLSETTD